VQIFDSSGYCICNLGSIIESVLRHGSSVKMCRLPIFERSVESNLENSEHGLFQNVFLGDVLICDRKVEVSSMSVLSIRRSPARLVAMF